MGDWTCEVIVATEGIRRVLRWHLVLADGLSRAEVEARAADLARGFYGPDIHVRAVTPERWSPERASAPTRGSPAPEQSPAPHPAGDVADPHRPGHCCGDGATVCGVRSSRESMSVPPALRRAVAFIESEAAGPIRLADIAAAAGIGARALQYDFARHYRTTPCDICDRYASSGPTATCRPPAPATAQPWPRSQRGGVFLPRPFRRPLSHRLRPCPSPEPPGPGDIRAAHWRSCRIRIN